MRIYQFNPTVKIITLIILLSNILPPNLPAQSTTINPRWLHGFWKAKWISHPGVAGGDFAVLHFRKTFELKEQPSSFIIHVSADNRYRLFVNGHSIGTGPARSDLANWNFETYDIGQWLHPGKNLVAATVWNFAGYRPYSQISYETAFILQGNDAKEEIVNTDASWKSVMDSAYLPRPIDKARLQTYIVTAEGEQVDGQKYSWGFESPDFDDSAWPHAARLWYAAKSRGFGTDGNWMLVPRSIPLAEETNQHFAAIRRTTVHLSSIDSFLAGSSSLEIPAHNLISVLFDQGKLSNAYPVLRLSHGRHSVIQLSYAEALVNQKREKGNRDSIEGKELVGFSDEYIQDGGNHRIYSPLFFRTFRYLEMKIETQDEPLVIEDFHSLFTGYPFKENASFKSSDEGLLKIWQTGWHTARLCAVDTYFDCPYYEQLQYVGDTRIQAMISLYVSGDDRLMRKAIDDISHSFIPDGLTQSRYPSRDMQIIPTFSLWWVCMIHDYWMHRKDDAFIKSHLNEMASVLEWYRERISENGILGPLSWWQFVDWSWPWVDSIRVGGVPPGASKGGSSILTLQFVYTLQRAANIMSHFGKPELAERYLQLARSLAKRTIELCWDQDRGLLADDYNKNEYSQHANILAVLTDAVPVASQKQLIEKIIADKKITPCTYYFTFYLFEALKKVKLGDRFLDMLQPWYDMIGRGLSTFAENPEPTRSDCHAWSASPDYELLSIVCGIRPASPGFDQVLIEPFPGKLNWIEGTVPHPRGKISVHMEKKDGKWNAQIDLPDQVNGIFVHEGREIPLKSGKQSVQW